MSDRFTLKRTSVPGRIPTGTTGNEDSFIKQGELAINTADKKIFSFDGTNIFEAGSNSYLGLSGGTINGNLNVTRETVVQSISASTIYSGGTNLYDVIKSTIAGTTTQITLSANSWVLSAQTVSLPGITVDSDIYLSPSGRTDQSAMGTYEIFCESAGTDVLNFSCGATPISDINIKVKVV